MQFRKVSFNLSRVPQLVIYTSPVERRCRADCTADTFFSRDVPTRMYFCLYTTYIYVWLVNGKTRRRRCCTFPAEDVTAFANCAAPRAQVHCWSTIETGRSPIDISDCCFNIQCVSVCVFVYSHISRIHIYTCTIYLLILLKAIHAKWKAATTYLHRWWNLSIAIGCLYILAAILYMSESIDVVVFFFSFWLKGQRGRQQQQQQQPFPRELL